MDARERAAEARALVSVGRHVHALRWLPAYRRAVGGRWAAIHEGTWTGGEFVDVVVSDAYIAHSWQQVVRCPAEWVPVSPDELDGMLCDPREHALRLNLTREAHRYHCDCEVYP